MILTEPEVRFGLEFLSALVILTQSGLFSGMKDLTRSFLPESTGS